MKPYWHEKSYWPNATRRALQRCPERYYIGRSSIVSGKGRDPETTQRNCQAVSLDSPASWLKNETLDFGSVLFYCGLIFSFLNDETVGVTRKYLHKDIESILMFEDKMGAFLETLYRFHLF